MPISPSMPSKTKPTAQSVADLSRTLTKSRFKLAFECPTKLYYDDRPTEYANDKNDDAFLKNLAKGGFQVGALAKSYFPDGHDITTLDKEAALKETNDLLLQENVVIFEAAFRFENLFIRADVVKKVGDTLFLYEVKAASYHPENDYFWNKTKNKADHLNNEWNEYLYDVAFQHHVVKHAYPNFKVEPYLYLANKMTAATVDGLNQRFLLSEKNGNRVTYDATLTEKELGEPILIAVLVSKEVAAIQNGTPNGTAAPDWPEKFTFAQWVSYLADNYRADTQMAPKVTNACKDCQFRTEKNDYPGKQIGFEECWTKALSLNPGTFEKRVPLFEIWKIGAGKFFDEGAYFVDQISEDDFITKNVSKKETKSGFTEAQRKAYQWNQVATEKSETYFDRDGFLEATVGCIFPLHFIDFETAMVAIPFNKGMSPYEQIAFQFSHHVMQRDGRVEHKGQWINATPGKFPNFEFVRKLKAELENDSGTIFRYHNHENIVLNQIRAQLLLASVTEVPDKEELISWIQTIAKPTGKTEQKWEPIRPMVDLFDLVIRFFWHPRMRNSNSIKAVLPAMLEFSPYLQAKYSKPIYGGKAEIRSLNLAETTWVKVENGKASDPYKMLPKVFGSWERDNLDRLYGDDELADGGAAMMAYAKMQFTEMSDPERAAITSALLRYCELDTLAMVMLWEGWNAAAKESVE